MAWLGWFEYDGNEIINVTRTEQYARKAGLHWFRPIFKNDALPYMLGDGLEYQSPFLDDAPWADPDIAASYDFMGLYPLEVTGIEDSTRQSTVTENVGDGGVPGRLRHGTKTVVFSVLLIATSDAGADYGFKWLKSVLLGGPCGPDMGSACNGATLCYLKSSPDMYLPADIPTGYQSNDPRSPGVYVRDPEDCLYPYLRSLRKVVFNSGPTVSSRRDTSDGGEIWTVTFTGVSGSPYELGMEVPVLSGLLDDDDRGRGRGGDEPDEPDYDEPEDDSFTATKKNPYVGLREDDDYYYDHQGFIYAESDYNCDNSVPDYQPLYDPLCPAVIPPPEPPSVPLGCWTKPKNWKRRSISIPKRYVPLWGEVVPKIEIHTKRTELRSLRLRFYANPYGRRSNDDDDDACEYCGDIVVSYLPRDHTLILDGSEEMVYAEGPGGQRRRADALVFKSDGTPFDWPALSCGSAYTMTIDLPQTQVEPSIDLYLYARAV